MVERVQAAQVFVVENGVERDAEPDPDAPPDEAAPVQAAVVR
jgi:hypothetical protein